jgi:hypothetical protein
MGTSINMSISAEANLSDMLSFFETFLRAAAYPLDTDHELGIERKAPDFGSTQDFWEEDGISLVGNLWYPVTPGAYSEDTLCFSTVSTGNVTF